MIRVSKFWSYSFGILKDTNGNNGKPLPNMEIFYLTNNNNKQLSFWNDVPMSMQGDSLNCCIEVPKEMSNKYEVIKEMKYHPFMQDTKKNVFSK